MNPENSSLYSDRIVCISVIEDRSIEDLFYYDKILIAFGQKPGHRLCASQRKLDILNKLKDNELIIDINDVFDESEREAILKEQDIVRQSLIDEIIKKPNRFGRAIEYGDMLILPVANKALKKSINVIPRYALKHFSSRLKTTGDQVISFIFNTLPRIDSEHIDINYLLDFIKDEETQRKKRRLFAWQNKIETEIKNGTLDPKHLPDLIATNLNDYTQWFEKNLKRVRMAKREFVFYISLSLLGGVTIPMALRKYFEWKERKLDLMDDEKAPGRELAYVIHVNDKFENYPKRKD